jgi:hypothetical protein
LLNLPQTIMETVLAVLLTTTPFLIMVTVRLQEATSHQTIQVLVIHKPLSMESIPIHFWRTTLLPLIAMETRPVVTFSMIIVLTLTILELNPSLRSGTLFNLNLITQLLTSVLTSLLQMLPFTCS